ncbi:hypothetical protein J9317_15875 [Metabacillus sp. KIGAM252]|uniref:ABC transporter permease n=1 Tax=Metabacillus flavus TaxID=2823519 RepID=A0ABS5LHJ2_9BACI|nr:hypothetical protein [Metabacillus flavus]MBS2970225.1 hypothetical protein [Metabacillus flavus]
MNRFLKLVNFEVNRFAKIYFGLIILTILGQMIAVFNESNKLTRYASEYMREQRINAEQYVSTMEPLSFSSIVNSSFYMGPILLSICALLFYVFFIWYRDWFANNAFMYRLLMIPVSRMNIYFAKTAAILLMIFGLVALQLLLLPFEFAIYQSIVPQDLRGLTPLSYVMNSNAVLSMIIPSTFLEFVLYYGAGITLVLVLNTIILFERSYKWLGAGIGIGYGVLACLVALIPVFLAETLDQLYPIEIIYIGIACVGAIGVLSVFMSRFLLAKKITV